MQPAGSMETAKSNTFSKVVPIFVSAHKPYTSRGKAINLDPRAIWTKTYFLLRGP